MTTIASVPKLFASVARSPQSVIVEIGGIPILLHPSNPEFCALLEQRYAGFINPQAKPVYRFDIHLTPSAPPSDHDAHVFRQGHFWHIHRGDFRATWDPRARRGSIHQCPNPYSIDTVLRIVHSLALAQQGGFLVHAASAIRSGRAFLFAGISGAGKTTMARLAPPGAVVLTDEISYVRRIGPEHRAFGTPFAGELARVGANTSAPLDTLFLLEQGPQNCIRPFAQSDAARALMRHILFFAHEKELVARVFDSVLEFISSVRVARLIFTPDRRAWDLVAPEFAPKFVADLAPPPTGPQRIAPECMPPEYVP
jgi:hypothetical protein